MGILFGWILSIPLCELSSTINASGIIAFLMPLHTRAPPVLLGLGLCIDYSTFLVW